MKNTVFIRKCGILVSSALLFGCGTYSREVKDHFIKEESFTISSQSISNFKDCYLKELSIITTKHGFSPRVSIRELNFSDYTRIESMGTAAPFSSVDIYKDGRLEFYKVNTFLSSQPEHDAFIKCHNSIKSAAYGTPLTLATQLQH